MSGKIKTIGSTLAMIALLGSTQAQASPNAIHDQHRDKAQAIQKIILQQLSLKKLSNTFYHPIDARQYGVPIRNPFTKVPKNVSDALLKEGINLAAMSRYRSVYVAGMLAGASARKLINTDPGTILVIGSGTIAHDPVYSRGPVVILGNATLSAGIYGENLVWYSNDAPYETSDYSMHIGLPSIVRGNNPNHSFGNNLYTPQEEAGAAAALNRKVNQ